MIRAITAINVRLQLGEVLGRSVCPVRANIRAALTIWVSGKVSLGKRCKLRAERWVGISVQKTLWHRERGTCQVEGKCTSQQN